MVCVCNPFSTAGIDDNEFASFAAYDEMTIVGRESYGAYASFIAVGSLAGRTAAVVTSLEFTNLMQYAPTDSLIHAYQPISTSGGKHRSIPTEVQQPDFIAVMS
jgi:hypothetical protein